MIHHKEFEAPPEELPPDTELAPELAPPPPSDKVLPAGDEIKALPPPADVPPAPPPPHRRRRGWVWLLLFVALGYGVFRLYQAREQKKEAAERQQAARQANRTVSVAAAPARVGNLPIYLRGLGTVTAYNTVNVKARVDGPLISVNFREGQHVNKGDLLVEIDPRTFQATLNQAQGQLARDEAQLHDAEANQARYDALWKEGVIAKQQRDTQAAQVGQFQGTIAADQAAINNARLQLSFTRITAPISGRIGLRQVDVGNIVHAGDANPIVVITQMQPIAVLFTIPADDLPKVLPKLRAGAKLPVEAYDRADQNRIASGTLETVDNTIDPNTGTSRLKAIFDNPYDELFPNQFVNCRLLIETRRRVALIPVPAVQRGPQGSYVYVIQPDGTAAMRPVTLGASEGNDQQITSGIAPGEMVVTDGQDKLEQGSKVQVRQDGAGGAGGGTGNPPNAGGAPAGRPAQGGRRGGRGQ